VSAEPIGHVSWAPNPARQRLRDYTVEDILDLPDGAPRVELDNGVAVVVPKPTISHNDIGNLLWMWFRQNAPAGLRPATEAGVTTGLRDSLEPDVMLLRLPVANHHLFDPEQVALVVEVVSPGTKRRDRLEKPALYAQAGVPHFWRIEQDPVHVFAYDLVDGRYEPVADSTDELVLSAPFAIKLPIRDITP
jgi:Uma2 family endonuclease